MLTFRELELGDRGALCEIFRDTFSSKPWNDDWSDSAQLNAYLDDLTKSHNSLCFGLFHDGTLIGASLGSVKHWWRGTEYYIDEFFIHPNHQKRGCGQALLEHVESTLKQKQIYNIFLQTDLHTPAFRFYKKNGFTMLSGHVPLSKYIK